MPTSTSKTESIGAGLELRLQLRKIHEHRGIRAKTKDILKLALGRTLIEDTDRRHARVAESDVIFFRFIFFQLFEVKADLEWCDKATRFSPDGWRHTWHKEILDRTGLSKDELRRKVTRFTKLGFIETGHRQKEESLQVNGLYIRPVPGRVWEILSRLDEARKTERQSHQKHRYHDPLRKVGFIADGPATPQWLQERQIAWSLLYQSNFRVVLPAAIRYAKTGNHSRRRITDRRKASVPDCLIKFALGMCDVFGVDEFGGQMSHGDSFDTEGNRILSVPQILKATQCSPKEARVAGAFYKKSGIYQTFFKTGARYTKTATIKRIPWARWSFSKFLEFLQFPGSRLRIQHERMRFVIVQEDENRGKQSAADRSTLENSSGFSLLQLELSDALNAQVFVQERSSSQNGNCSILNGSGILREEREQAAPAFSFFCGGDQKANGHLDAPRRTSLPWVKDAEMTIPAEHYQWASWQRQMQLARDGMNMVITMPPAPLWALEQRLKKDGVQVTNRVPLPRVNAVLVDGPRRNGVTPPGQWHVELQGYTTWKREQKSLLNPDRFPGESAADFVFRLQLALDAPETVPEWERPAIQVALAKVLDEMNPFLPGIETGEEELGGGVWCEWLPPFRSFVKRYLSVESQKSLGTVPLTAASTAPVIVGTGLKELIREQTASGLAGLFVPEKVAFCAAALEYVCTDSRSMGLTPKRMRRIWNLVRTGQMTPDQVVWYCDSRSTNEFEGIDEWLNWTRLDPLLSRWTKLNAAQSHLKKMKDVQALQNLPSLDTIEHTDKIFEASLQQFARSHSGQQYPLIVKLGWLHRKGYDVKRLVPQVTMDLLAKRLRSAPWLYMALRAVLPLSEWCGFVAAEQRSLEAKAQEQYSNAMARNMILKDFYEQEARRERDFEEWQELREARKNGYSVLSRREMAKMNEQFKNKMLTSPEPDFLARCVPTPLRDLNYALGGGFDRPSLTLVSAITGGGKTTLCLQMALSFTTAGLNVLFISSEFSNDYLLPRLYANGLTIDYTMLNQMDLRDGLPVTMLKTFPQRRDQIAELERVITNQLMVREWAPDFHMKDLGVMATFNARPARFEPNVIVLDGFSTVADAAIESVRRQRKTYTTPYRDVRNCYEPAVASFCELSKIANCAVLVTVQADKTRASRTNRVTAGMIQQVPDLYERFSGKVGFVGISALRDPDKHTDQEIQFLNVARTRNGPGGLVRVGAEFQFQRFADAKYYKRAKWLAPVRDLA
jgi:archaellum biogenesis ATPase FlaH